MKRITSALLVVLLLTGCAARVHVQAPTRREVIERPTWVGTKTGPNTYVVLTRRQNARDVTSELCPEHGEWLCHETIDPRILIQIERTRK